MAQDWQVKELTESREVIRQKDEILKEVAALIDVALIYLEDGARVTASARLKRAYKKATGKKWSQS